MAVPGIGAASPGAELRLEKLVRELTLEAVDLPADGGLPACHHTTQALNYPFGPTFFTVLFKMKEGNDDQRGLDVRQYTEPGHGNVNLGNEYKGQACTEAASRSVSASASNSASAASASACAAASAELAAARSLDSTSWRTWEGHAEGALLAKPSISS
ncbi:MAG: hypothetical protein FRX49_08195 [Trebouxia sp. A1-2]|nr:MAG: hypothetical protein FRX49_08195 [Trebouxia sp. A1-2]